MLTISSNPNNILEVEQYLKVAKSEYKICDDKYPEILISLTEAVNNAIIHGNNADEQKRVEISLECDSKELSIQIVDEGAGFDPNEVPDPTQPENLECCGGRGVHIMKSLADRVAYLNNGSTVKMVFKLS